MELICQEIGINVQHFCETNVPDRYLLICDKTWLQSLERYRKITNFPTYPNLNKYAHPEEPLQHPWTKIIVQTYKKQPNTRVFPLQQAHVDIQPTYELPLSYSQAVAQVAQTNFKNLWEVAFKRYASAYGKGCKPSNVTTNKVQVNTPPACAILPYDVVLKELIQRTFHCAVIHCKLDRLKDSDMENVNAAQSLNTTTDCHANILPALIAIESSTHISVFFYPPAITTTLYDCITYSPAVLSKSYNKPLFLFYQILQLSKQLQAEGLCLGDIRLHDILLRDNLWLQVVPRLRSNLLQANASGEEDLAAPMLNSGGSDMAVELGPNEQALQGVESSTSMLDADDDDDDAIHCSTSTKFDLKFAYDLEQFTLREYCEMWCNGQLSNFDYLTILNNASGRKLNNPAYHHIMPWVTDFTSRNGLNWRDLSKSKYRLNKGDVQLDLMFTHASQYSSIEHLAQQESGFVARQVPHHVSDFLSEITYFVYMARRTPQQVLCEHVRPIWVPAEYPISIQRLQEWTPDECIPEFYSDPMIFKSIHEDLPDLELPSWATCPEDFICKHREALESQYVSERLHHWIDLNFGYKLSGKAAVKSKNVCLSMVDQHKHLCQRGIVQLFNQPHPAKRFANSWFQKTAPRLQQLQPSAKTQTNLNCKETRRLAKSSENLTVSQANDVDALARSAAGHSPRMSLRGHNTNTNEELSSSSNFYQSTNFIELPKDYNPIALLQSLEQQQSFYARTFPKQRPTANAQEKIVNSDMLFDDNSEEHSFTNQLFVEATPVLTGRKSKSLLAPCLQTLKKRTLKYLLTEQRERKHQVLGCLVVELFAMQRLRPLLMNGYSAQFEERLQACRTVARLNKHDIPKCMRYIVSLLLQLQPMEVVSSKGLPPTTAAQILEPIFANLLCPFPTNFYPTYMLIRSLRNFDFAFTLLDLYTHFDCNGKQCSKYTEIDRKRVLHARKIAECKVTACSAHIRHLLEPLAYEQFSMVELLIPHIVDLLKDEQTSILTAWNLFDPVAQALGIAQTQKYLLLPIMKLYDVECLERGMMSVRTRSSMNAELTAGHLRFSTSSSFKSRKSVKLYHHSFLLRLIVRFGLRCFLQNFIAPLIEAVGGYKEPEDGNGFHYHSTQATGDTGSRRTSKHLSDVLATDNSGRYSMLSAGGLNEVLSVPDNSTLDGNNQGLLPKTDMEEVFTFEDDANSDRISNAGTSENKSIDSFDMRPTPAEEAIEDENNVETTPEKIAISEIIYGSKLFNLSFEEADKISLKSQTGYDSPSATPTTASTGTHIGLKSPTIEIPASSIRRSYQLNTIDCDIGSRKSIDSFEIITQAVLEEQKQNLQKQKSEELINEPAVSGDTVDSAEAVQASVKSKMSEAKAAENNRISEMSAESLVWLSHRLGPVLSSRFITRNLLKMLTLCYLGQENLLPECGLKSDEKLKQEASDLNYFSIADARVVGDRSASRVLECLMSISALFGEEIILLQYFPHISELVALSTKRLTASLEGAVISALQLLKYITPCLMDSTIMEQLKDTILNAILLPVLRLIGSARLTMPSGYLGRSVLARKFLDAVYVLCVRLGSDMSKEHLCIPLLRPFFLIFDKAFGVNDFDTNAISPPAETTPNQREIEELRDVFGPALAHTSYLAFLRFLGEAIMQRTIVNLEFILTLCHEFEQPAYKANDTVDAAISSDGQPKSPTDAAGGDASELSNSFGTQVIGNRIEVLSPSEAQAQVKQDIGSMEVLDMVAYKLEHMQTTRHLKGNWLAYWRHEISRSDQDTMLNLKQIKLQSFVGHTNSVRGICALDNENSFISASKDKTVKLWSLRSEGDGQKATNCQFTYTAHKKAIHSLAFLEAMRYVVSCDSGVHIWDPFIGRPLGILDSAKQCPITVVKSMPSPSPLVVAGTAESTVKIIDTRCMQYVNEWRVNAATQYNATVRCLTIAPSGNWLCAGMSTGSIVMLDTRTGMLLNSWRPMECDLLQLAAPNDQQLVSSALDHSLAVWHANDGILHYQLRPPAEPAHFLQTIGSELIFATTGNRIGIYSDLSSSHAHHAVTKLRSETFRGVLTSLAVLPLNRAFLAGNESGNIVLLC